MTMNCKSCGQDKPESQMFTRLGRPIRTCRECKEKQFKLGITTRAKTMQSANISAPVRPNARPFVPPNPAMPRPPLPAESAPAATNASAIPPAPAPTPAAAPPAGYPVLSISPGYGVNASIEDGCLVLLQGGAEESSPDHVVLTLMEARALFAHVRAWLE